MHFGIVSLKRGMAMSKFYNANLRLAFFLQNFKQFCNTMATQDKNYS
jgi:hypothetical protein